LVVVDFALVVVFLARGGPGLLAAAAYERLVE
jgi:hypothetical protein